MRTARIVTLPAPAAPEAAPPLPSPAVTQVPITANRNCLNMAPAAWHAYQMTPEWRLRGRVATGYGTPNLSQLFVTSAGVPGNNTQLQSQTNLGYDVGVDWTPNRATKVIVTGFYELFNNEFITQSPGAGLMNFTFNVPHSTHRGVEVAVDWRPLPGWQYLMAYIYDNQYYTEYVQNPGPGAAKLAAGILHLCVSPVLEVGDAEIGQKRVGGDELGSGQMPRGVGLGNDGCGVLVVCTGQNGDCPRHAGEMREVERARCDGQISLAKDLGVSLHEAGGHLSGKVWVASQREDLLRTMASRQGRLVGADHLQPCVVQKLCRAARARFLVLLARIAVRLRTDNQVRKRGEIFVCG